VAIKKQKLNVLNLDVTLYCTYVMSQFLNRHEVNSMKCSGNVILRPECCYKHWTSYQFKGTRKNWSSLLVEYHKQINLPELGVLFCNNAYFNFIRFEVHWQDSR